MTADQFATRVLLVKSSLTAKVDAQLPSECRLVDRYIFSGITTEEDWLAALRGDDDKIRLLVILMSDLNLNLLSQTTMGKQFNPKPRVNFELYHEYKVGTDEDNTEKEFISDACRVAFALAKGRTINKVEDNSFLAIIESLNFRLGIRPSKITTLHYAKGEAVLDMQGLSYE